MEGSPLAVIAGPFGASSEHRNPCDRMRLRFAIVTADFPISAIGCQQRGVRGRWPGSFAIANRGFQHQLRNTSCENRSKRAQDNFRGLNVALRGFVGARPRGLAGGPSGAWGRQACPEHFSRPANCSQANFRGPIVALRGFVDARQGGLAGGLSRAWRRQACPEHFLGACKLLPWCPRAHPGGLKTARGLAPITRAANNLGRPQCVIRGALEHTTRGLAHTTRAENNTDPLRAIFGRLENALRGAGAGACDGPGGGAW